MSDKTAKSMTELNATGSRDELRDLIKEFRTAVLVTREGRGMPRARPMAIVRCDDDAAVWFATADHSPKVAELASDPHVAVICHRDRDEAWVSLSGRAELVRDRAKIKELWDAGLQAWFEGPDDPSLLLIRVTPVHAEYYEPTKPFFVRAFEMAKGLVSDEPPRVGTTKHVDLDRLSEPGRLSH